MSARGWRTTRNTLVLIAILVFIWQCLYWSVGDIALTSPWHTLKFTAHLLTTEQFHVHLLDTAKAFLLAFAVAMVLGLAIGFWLGFNRLSGDIFEPMVVAVYSIPKVTLYPIILLAFGLGLPAKIAFGALHGVIPIMLFTLTAVRSVKPVLVKTGRTMHLSPLQMTRSILFPAALPEIVTGLRIGFSLTLIGSLLAEMFASQRGLGFLLMNGIGLHNVEMIMSITLLLVVFAATVSSILLYYDRRLHRRSGRDDTVDA